MSEAKQLSKAGLYDYLTDGWNYLDIFPLIFVPLITLWTSIEEFSLDLDQPLAGQINVKADCIRDYL
jgi:hypothetical protein